MRYRFSDQNLRSLFSEIESTGLTWAQISEQFGIERRTLYDWRRGKITIPKRFISFLEKELRILCPPPQEILPDGWAKSTAGSKGARLLYERRGNPGTPEGRAKGGRISLRSHAQSATSPFKRKKVAFPEKSADLAEFFGIVLGDGGVTQRQVTITLHKYDDREYAEYVARLIEVIFDCKPSLYVSRTKSVVLILLSRSDLIPFLLKHGLVVGSKVRQQVSIPSWIVASDDFMCACLRGLMDTDGCMYVDRHIIRGKKYVNAGMCFTNRSLPILNGFKCGLERLGFAPTQKTPFSVFLRRENEILRYFEVIGTSNPKHERRMQKFLDEKYGGSVSSFMFRRNIEKASK